MWTRDVLTDRRKAAALVAWALAFAYSWTPFEASFHSVRVLDPLDDAGWPGLGFHFLAFVAVGLLSRAAATRAAGGRLIPSIITRDLGLCVVVEVGQLFMEGRHAEIHDFAVNAAGVLSGHATLPAILGHPWTKAVSSATRNGRLVASRSIMFSCCIFWVAALVLPIRYASLSDWDLSYPLLLGNEKDGDRQWEGEIRNLALYDRSLTPGEIDGSSPEGAIAVYDFTESPLILGPRGKDTIGLPGEPLSRRIAAQGSFSVDVWLKPDALTLTGPARIVGISESAWHRNFSLAQEGRSIYFRVRNPLNGPNGINHEFRCSNALSNAFSHVVVTYDRGAISLYRDGRQLCRTLDQREPSLLLGLGSSPASHTVTALLAALTFLLSGAVVSQLLLIGYGALAIPLVLGALLGSPPATSLYYWFGPLLLICGYASRVTDRSSQSRSPSA